MSSLWTSPERLIGYGLLLALWVPSALVGGAIHTGIRVALILLASWQLGHILLPASWSKSSKLVLGATVWASLLSLLTTAAYYLSIPIRETTYTIIESLLLVGSTVGYCLIVKEEDERVEEENRPAPQLKNLLVYGALSFFATGAFLLFARTLNQHGTTISVQTPWTLLPKGSFFLLTIPFFAALIAAWKDRSRLAVIITSAASWLSVTIITPLLYPLGYGFDGFIHRASQLVLATNGTLQPKPLYYIGQYVWTIWLAQAFDLSLRSLDIWLVPLSILLPLIALLVWTKKDVTHSAWRIPLTILFLPLSAFVSTTPQSFSYVLGAAALITCLWPHEQKRSWIIPLLWASWATAVHPLGGLPFLALVGGLWISQYFKSTWKKNALLTIATIAGLLAIPLAFWAQGRLGGAAITWSWDKLLPSSLGSFLSTIILEPRQTLNLWIDSTEWAAICLQLFLVLVGVFQILVPKRPAYRWLALMGIGLICVRWALEHVASFTFLINYEQNNYTERLSVLSAIFLAPGAAHWVEERLAAISKHSAFLFCGLLLAFSALWSVRVYNSLPRYDAAKASSGWNVSQADFEAVHWIHEQAKDVPYAVLANQTVSAAALETYGFLRYTNDVFYYPLPTGGPLYQLFLKASSIDATKDEIKKAAALTESKTVFVVIDKYWWNADRVNENLTQFADQSISFKEGAVWVYRFDNVGE